MEIREHMQVRRARSWEFFLLKSVCTSVQPVEVIRPILYCFPI